MLLVAWIALDCLAATPATAAQPTHPLCPLLLHQHRVDEEERELDVELARSRLAAAERVFELIDRLGAEEAVQRTTRLAAGHERDVAAVEVTRRLLLLERAKAERSHLEIVCAGSDGDGGGESSRDRLEAARARYAQVDCHRIGKELAIAELDLAYREELLEGLDRLRGGELATREELIRARQEVEEARIRVERHGRRVQACIDSGAAAGAPTDPP